MTARLVLPARIRQALTELLVRDDGLEHLAVGLAGRHRSSSGLRLLLRDVIPAGSGDYIVHSAFHLEMQPAYWARIAKRARISDESIVVFHSHPFDEDVPRFSPSDDWGEHQLMPKLAARAAGPHATVVWSPGGARGRVHGDAVQDLHVVPTFDIGVPHRSAPDAVYQRQVLALGPEGQRRLRSARIGVVGLGGTGSHVVQQLLHLGVGEIIAIDPDTIERSNLSRVLGATTDDATHRRSKTVIVNRMAASLGGRTKVTSVRGDVRDDEVARRLVSSVDLIVGCTDTHWSRLVLNVLAFAFMVPVVDLGVELQATGAMGGRVTVIGPGETCLWCLGVLDEVRIRAEQMPHELRGAQRPLGYIPDLDVPAPAVVSINGVIASLAVTEILERIVGLRAAGSAPSMLVYRLADGTVRRIAPVSGGCGFCSGRVVGAGDDAILPTRKEVAIDDSPAAAVEKRLAKQPARGAPAVARRPEA
jgi:molybdopterin-synthase adenylyltransferase